MTREPTRILDSPQTPSVTITKSKPGVQHPDSFPPSPHVDLFSTPIIPDVLTPVYTPKSDLILQPLTDVADQQLALDAELAINHQSGLPSAKKRQRSDLVSNHDPIIALPPQGSVKGKRYGRPKKLLSEETKVNQVDEDVLTLANLAALSGLGKGEGEKREARASSNQDHVLALPHSTGFDLMANTINEYNSPFRFPDADMIVISSDGFHFHVHQALLVTLSPILCKMIIDCRTAQPSLPPILRCVHPVYETSHSLDLFFRVIYNSPLPTITFSNYRSFSHTAQFMRQHGCTHSEAILRNRLRNLPAGTKETTSPLLIFLTGALMGDPVLCARAIEHGRGWTFGGTNAKGEKDEGKVEEGNMEKHPDHVSLDMNNSLPGYSVLDPKAWSDSIIADVPPRYVGLMMRLSIRYGIDPGMSQTTWQAMAHDFRQNAN